MTRLYHSALISFSINATIMGSGNANTRFNTPNIKVLENSLKKLSSAKKVWKCLNPTHGLFKTPK